MKRNQESKLMSLGETVEKLAPVPLRRRGRLDMDAVFVARAAGRPVLR